MSTQTATATFGGGCFWCLDAVFEMVRGVSAVATGYTGGHVPNPTYQAVCAKQTGHAEVVQVTFDPAAVSFRDLLGVFFAFHDPTTLNRQGADIGPQYRSAIFAHDAEQKKAATEVIADLTARKVFPNKIVTEVKPAVEFYPAEDHHQGFYRNHPTQVYCELVVHPKVLKFRESFQHLMK